MTQPIAIALVGCVVLSAVGGFGAPLLCRGATEQDQCGQQWRNAAAGALTAAGTLGTLLARLSGGDRQP